MPEPPLSRVRRPETIKMSQNKQGPLRSREEAERSQHWGPGGERLASVGSRLPQHAPGRPTVPGPSQPPGSRYLGPAQTCLQHVMPLSPEVAPALRSVPGLPARARDSEHRDTQMLFLSRTEANYTWDSGKQDCGGGTVGLRPQTLAQGLVQDTAPRRARRLLRAALTRSCPPSRPSLCWAPGQGQPAVRAGCGRSLLASPGPRGLPGPGPSLWVTLLQSCRICREN